MDSFWLAFWRPFGALVLFTLAWLVARALWYFIPAGRVKSLLFSKEFGKRHADAMGIALPILGFSVMGLVYYFTYY